MWQKYENTYKEVLIFLFMVDENYDKVLTKISRASGMDKLELERKVEAKRAKLAGLISKEGAAQVVAAELGINFDKEKLKIDELLSGMRKVNLIGKVINLFPVRTYKNNKGILSKVVNLVLADETSNIKVVLWDANHIELIEKDQIKKGSVIEITNGSIRTEEVHLGSFSELRLSEEKIENEIIENVVKEKKVSELKVGDTVKIRAFIVQSFEPKFFNVCPECKKKAIPDGAENFICQEHGIVKPEKRALMNIVLDDGTETIRVVLFNDSLDKIKMNCYVSLEEINVQRQNLLGKEIFFTGNVRMNKFFNQPEFISSDINEIDLDSLIGDLEK